MKTKIQFRTIEELDHLKTFVEDTVEQSLRKFESWHNFDVRLVLGTAKGRSHSHRPIFNCELILKCNEFSRPIIVRKLNSNFYHMVRDCLKSAEKILRRSSKIQTTVRRNNEYEFINDAARAA